MSHVVVLSSTKSHERSRWDRRMDNAPDSQTGVVENRAGGPHKHEVTRHRLLQFAVVRPECILKPRQLGRGCFPRVLESDSTPIIGRRRPDLRQHGRNCQKQHCQQSQRASCRRHCVTFPYQKFCGLSFFPLQKKYIILWVFCQYCVMYHDLSNTCCIYALRKLLDKDKI